VLPGVRALPGSQSAPLPTLITPGARIVGAFIMFEEVTKNDIPGWEGFLLKNLNLDPMAQ